MHGDQLICDDTGGLIQYTQWDAQRDILRLHALRRSNPESGNYEVNDQLIGWG